MLADGDGVLLHLLIAAAISLFIRMIDASLAGFGVQCVAALGVAIWEIPRHAIHGDDLVIQLDRRDLLILGKVDGRTSAAFIKSFLPERTSFMKSLATMP